MPGAQFSTDPGQYWLCSAIGSFIFFVEPLCSMVHLVRFSLGSFLGRLQCQMCCGLSFLGTTLVIRVVFSTLVCLIGVLFCYLARLCEKPSCTEITKQIDE